MRAGETDFIIEPEDEVLSSKSSPVDVEYAERVRVRSAILHVATGHRPTPCLGQMWVGGGGGGGGGWGWTHTVSVLLGR